MVNFGLFSLSITSTRIGRKILKQIEILPLQFWDYSSEPYLKGKWIQFSIKFASKNHARFKGMLCYHGLKKTKLIIKTTSELKLWKLCWRRITNVVGFYACCSDTMKIDMGDLIFFARRKWKSRISSTVCRV